MVTDNFINHLKYVDISRAKHQYDFLEVIGKSDNENIISDWLAFLLTPEKCGSDKPLKKFCGLCIKDFIYDEIKIEREYVLSNNRRIDILIKLKNAWIIIENKINSYEFNSQTIDYVNEIAEEIQSQNIDLHFVYLKPNYNKSSPCCSKFISLNYSDIVKCWQDITENDFLQNSNYVYFAEFMKLIKGKYVMNNEINFDDNTRFYLQYKEQFNSVEQSYNNSCILVKNKLLEYLSGLFNDDDGWIISYHDEYIQFYKKFWGNEVHFEIGTWSKQKELKDITFNRLINDNVEITYCLHAERGHKSLAGDFIKIKKDNPQLFCTEHYNFSNEDICIKSIKLIFERLQFIKDKFTTQIDNLLVCNG